MYLQHIELSVKKASVRAKHLTKTGLFNVNPLRDKLCWFVVITSAFKDQASEIIYTRKNNTIRPSKKNQN